MPVTLLVHTEQCTWRRGTGPCNCTPEKLTDLAAARAACGGDTSWRMQVGETIPPAGYFTLKPRPDRSQAPRHKAISD